MRTQWISDGNSECLSLSNSRAFRSIALKKNSSSTFYQHTWFCFHSTNNLILIYEDTSSEKVSTNLDLIFHTFHFKGYK